MKLLSSKSLLAFGLLAGLFAFNACQKDGLTPKESPETTPIVSAVRSPEHITYGVTLYDGVTPSQIVAIDEATGAVLATFPAFVDPYFGTSGSSPVQLVDLKGICRTSWGQFFITTGPGCFPNIYDNTLYKVNVDLNGTNLPLGLCSYFASTSPFGAPVSDLEFDPNTQHFFGLLNNTNQLVEIVDNGTNYGIYLGPYPITGIPAGSTLKGLTLVRDNTGQYLVGAANRTGSTGTATSLYRIPFAGGAANFITSLLPQNDISGGHCGIGFDLDLNHLIVNRRTFLGLNEINPWAPPLGLATNTTFWGATGFNFEDLSSSVY